MVLNSKTTQQIFETEFRELEINYDTLYKYTQKNGANFDDIIPRKLRLFRIRLLLVIGLKIDFDTDYSLVKSKDTAATYTELMKCNESWFAYESMKKYCELKGWHKNERTSPVNFLNNETLQQLNIDPILSIYNNQIQAHISQLKGFKADMISYLNFLHNHLSNRAKTLKGFIQETIELFEMDKYEFNPPHIFATLYATRNLFVHRGEAAKSGVRSYNNKIILLKTIYDFSILFQLRVINYAFMHQLESLKK